MNTHDCPGGCGNQVAYHHFACPGDWFRLPASLRQRIARNWQYDAQAHAEAMAEALQWYGRNRVPR